MKNEIHDKTPEKIKQISKDVLEQVNKIVESNYYKYVEELNKLIIGKSVIDSRAGNSGYALLLEDRKWVIFYYESGKLLWKICKEFLPENDFNICFLNRMELSVMINKEKSLFQVFWEHW